MTPTTHDDVRAAIDCIPADTGHDERVRLAFAVYDGIGDAGADIWHEWAARRSNPNEAEDRATWKSAHKPGPVKVATLFGMAKANGYTRKPVQAPAKPPSAAELKAQASARRDVAERKEAEQQQSQHKTASDAAGQWANASETGTAAYLVRKGFADPHGARFASGGVLLVPMRNAAGELKSLQRILPEKMRDKATGKPTTDKLYLPGTAKEGLFHLIGDAEGAAVVLVCEGFATGCSLHDATGRPVAVAFDSSNLPPVVRALRGRYPAARIVVAGDDDRDTEAAGKGNAGRKKATEAAKLANGVPVFPAGLPDGASDFNDMHAHAGLDAVRERIEQALQAAESTEGAQTPDRAKKAAPVAGKRAARADVDEGASGAAHFDRFRVDADGLWFDAPADDSGGAGRPVKVCGPLHVTALARDAHDNGAALLLEFDTRFRKGRRWLMPLQMLAGDGTAYRAELLNQGFMMPTDAKRRGLLTAYFQSRTPADLVKIVDRVGWIGRAYVLPRETLGDDGGERIIFQSDTPTEGTFAQRGTLDEWRERIGRLCVGNSRLTFAASCAFAGPLLAWAGGTDGGGVHLMGDSSCGKTTALKVAASVNGGRDYLQRWRASDNGLEGMAAQHSDALLCLDELAQLDPKVAGDSAYLLANGAGKVRANRTGGARPRLTWRLLFLSAGEIGLAEHMSEANKKTRAGQELRMIDLAADAGAGRGIFETLHEFESGGTLAQHLARATESTYGTPGRVWLEWLTKRTEGLARTLRERMDAIEGQFVPEAAAGQVQRVGRRFALIAAAGELATEAGVTQWPAGEATTAARACFEAWIAARPGGIGLTEDAQMLRQMRGWFGLHGDSRFKPWHRTDSDNKPNTPMMAGWRKEIMGDGYDSTGATVGDVPVSREWFVLPDVFRTEACKGFNEKAALRLLADRGHLVREGKHFGCRASPPGAEKCTVYRVKSSLLGDSEE